MILTQLVLWPCFSLAIRGYFLIRFKTVLSEKYMALSMLPLSAAVLQLCFV